MNHPYLSECIDRIQQVSEDAMFAFENLNEMQLNWKPNADSWSVGQCLDHLIVSNRLYFPIFDSILNGTKKKTFWERLPFMPKVWGNAIVKALAPSNKDKTKTFPVFEPSQSQIPTAILSNFVKNNEQLIQYFQRLDGADHNIIITSPVAKFVTYSLGNTFKLLTNHEERHFLQAKRVMELFEFP